MSCYWFITCTSKRYNIAQTLGGKKWQNVVVIFLYYIVSDIISFEVLVWQVKIYTINFVATTKIEQ